MSKHVQDVDHGYKRIEAELKRMAGAFTAVGFHSNAGKHKVPTRTIDKRIEHAGLRSKAGLARLRASEQAKAEGGQLDVATIAAFAEFGTSKAPKRGFMRQASELYERDLAEFRKALLSAIYKGNMTVARALAMLGQRHEDQIKRTIVTGSFVPNAPSTIAAKGSSKPLIDTAQMLQSVRHAETIPALSVGSAHE